MPEPKRSITFPLHFKEILLVSKIFAKRSVGLFGLFSLAAGSRNPTEMSSGCLHASRRLTFVRPCHNFTLIAITIDTSTGTRLYTLSTTEEANTFVMGLFTSNHTRGTRGEKLLYGILPQFESIQADKASVNGLEVKTVSVEKMCLYKLFTVQRNIIAYS